MKKFLLGLFIVLGGLTVRAQDTLTFLQYNLLNYGNFTSYCPSSINNVSRKTGYIGTIVHYVKPDIFSVNEMTGTRSYHDYLLNNGLNTDGINYYAKASDTLNAKDAYLVNVLYYNKNKLGEAGHTVAQTYVRHVDIYKLYYKSANLNQGDTTFIYCVVAHLKAGRDSGGSITNQDKRKIMAENTMAYIATHHPGNNYLLMGDFNVYTDQEPAFQEFINYKDANIRFNDPVNQIGDWHNNPDYSHFQTQSTHAYSNDCAVGGGMDDRFDFILLSNNVKHGNKKVKYVAGSFHVVGQDGKHFNEAINVPANTSVPANVLRALYNNSDHLPVTLKVAVSQPAGIPQFHTNIDKLTFTNPVKDELNFSVTADRTTSLHVEVFSLVGKRVMQHQFSIYKGGRSQQTLDISRLTKGLYILRFTEPNGQSFSRKLLKY